jgi:hypothetical protein
MAEALQALQNLFTLGFVLSSMAAMGVSLTVATGNFADPNVVVTVMAAGALGMLILFPVAAELGRRATARHATAPVAPVPAEPEAGRVG